MNIKAIVHARMIEVHGQKRGAQRALAKLVAPLWGYKDWQSAEKRLSQFFAEDGQDMTSEPLGVLLDVLKLPFCAEPLHGTAKSSVAEVEMGAGI